MFPIEGMIKKAIQVRNICSFPYSDKHLGYIVGFAFVFFGASFAATASEHKCLSLLTILPFDKNFSFSLDYEEFLQMSQWRFGDLDTDQDNQISREELPPGNIHMSLELGEEETMFDWERFSFGLPAFFNFIDSSGDGKLSISEYRSLCKNGWAF